jgi:hypothetical protein
MASNEETSNEHKHTRLSTPTADEKKTSDNNQKKETGFECNVSYQIDSRTAREGQRRQTERESCAFSDLFGHCS